MLDVRPALIVAAMLGLLLATFLRAAAVSPARMTGRVSATDEEAEEGHFVIIGDSNTVVIDVSRWDYMIDYLRASNGAEVTLTLGPK